MKKRFSKPTVNFYYGTGDLSDAPERLNGIIGFLGKTNPNLSSEIFSMGNSQVKKGYKYSIDYNAVSLINSLKIGILDYCENNAHLLCSAQELISKTNRIEFFFKYFNYKGKEIFVVNLKEFKSHEVSGKEIESQIFSFNFELASKSTLSAISYFESFQHIKKICIIINQKIETSHRIARLINENQSRFNIEISFINNSDLNRQDSLRYTKSQESIAFLCLDHEAFNAQKSFIEGFLSHYESDLVHSFDASLGEDCGIFISGKTEKSLLLASIYFMHFAGNTENAQQILSNQDAIATSISQMSDIDYIKNKLQINKSNYNHDEKINLSEHEFIFPTKTTLTPRHSIQYEQIGSKCLLGYNIKIISAHDFTDQLIMEIRQILEPRSLQINEIQKMPNSIEIQSVYQNYNEDSHDYEKIKNNLYRIAPNSVVIVSKIYY